MKKNGQEKKAPKKSGQRLLNALIVLALGTMLLSGGMILYQMVFLPWQSRAVTKEYQDFLGEKKRPESSNMVKFESTEVLEYYLPLLEKNPDFAGWMTIPGTELNHPVFYTPEDQNYYLRRNANGADDRYGSLFLSKESTLNPQAQVLVMYGHNMEDDDLMFGQLTNFLKEDFMRQTPVFTFDTIYRMGQWKVIAVCYASTNFADNGFNYVKCSYDTETEFYRFLWECRTRSLYQIEDDATYDDAFLVCSTCMYDFWGERLILVARRLRENERAEDVSGENIRKNPYYRMPKEYYDYYTQSVEPTMEQVMENYRMFYGKDAAYQAGKP